MVTYCTVCKNNNRKNKNISYFTYPRESIRRYEWLKAVDRVDLMSKLGDVKIRQQYRICEDHFERTCIKLSKNKIVKYLVDNAFPTLNLPPKLDLSSSLYKIIGSQEIEKIEITPVAKISSSSNNCFNEIITLEDQTSCSIQTESGKDACESGSAQTALPSVGTARKRKLAFQHEEEKEMNTFDLDSVTNEDFLKLSDKCMPKALECRMRWRNLRDSYRRVQHKKKKGIGFSSKYNGEMLSFLNDYYSDEKTDDNINPLEINEEEEEKNDNKACTELTEILIPKSEIIINDADDQFEVQYNHFGENSSMSDCIEVELQNSQLGIDGWMDGSNDCDVNQEENPMKPIQVSMSDVRTVKQNTVSLSSKLNEANRPMSPTHAFFSCMADLVCKFPPEKIADVRMKICSMVSETELAILCSAQNK